MRRQEAERNATRQAAELEKMAAQQQINQIAHECSSLKEQAKAADEAAEYLEAQLHLASSVAFTSDKASARHGSGGKGGRRRRRSGGSNDGYNTSATASDPVSASRGRDRAHARGYSSQKDYF